MEKLKLTSSARALSRAATFVGDLIKLAVMLAFVFPFYWMVITAFKPYVESMDVPPTLWPQTWTLEEFLKLCARCDNMLIDFELKEYPVEGNEAVAYECADRIIQMLEEYGFGERCVLNSFNGKLLEQDRSYR